MSEKPEKPDVKSGETKLAKFNQFEGLLGSLVPEFEKVWLKSIPFDSSRFVGMTLNLIRRKPNLLNCDPFSLFAALRTCAEFSLYPDDIRGHCWIIPRYDKQIGGDRANWQLGYKGGVLLFRRNPISAPGQSVMAQDVYRDELDTFRIQHGYEGKESKEILEHHPRIDLTGTDGRKLAGSYAILNYRDGDHSGEFVPIHVLDEIRDKYAGKKGQPPGPDSPWFASEVSRSWMRKKSALTQSLKLSPALDDDTVSKAVALDEQSDADVQILDHGLTAGQLALAQKLLTAENTVQIPSSDVKQTTPGEEALDAMTGEAKAVNVAPEHNVAPEEEKKPEEPKAAEEEKGLAAERKTLLAFVLKHKPETKFNEKTPIKYLREAAKEIEDEAPVEESTPEPPKQAPKEGDAKPEPKEGDEDWSGLFPR